MTKTKVETILSTWEKDFVKEREELYHNMLGAIEAAKQFKMGDFLIASQQRRYEQVPRLITNSYGAVKKFQVVHVDQNDVPYMKELNKTGKPMGSLISPVETNEDGFFSTNAEYLFEVDPDYTDSIILQDEENYDASAVHKDKSDVFKAITAHNKTIKIPMENTGHIAKWFDANVKVGDVYYKSIKTHFTVLEIKPVPRISTGQPMRNETFIKVQDSKGKIKDLVLQDFVRTALYTSRPRSYGELKDPK